MPNSQHQNQDKPILSRIKKLQGKNPVDENIVRVMKYFGFNLNQMETMPLPTFYTLIQMINKFSAEEKASLKKRR